MTTDTNSNRTITVSGTTIPLYSVLVMRSAMKLYLQYGIQANHGYSPSNMRAWATTITGASYPRSKQGLQRAHDDVHAIIEALKAEG